MAAWLPSRDFLVNNPDYAPFGWSWLRGITPGRLAIVIVVVVARAIQGAHMDFAFEYVRSGMTWRMLDVVLNNALRLFTAGLPLLLLVVFVEYRTQRWTTGRRLGALATAVLVGAAAMGAVWVGLLALRFGQMPRNLPGFFLIAMHTGLVVATLLTAVLHFVGRKHDADRRAHETRLARAAIDRQIVEARLQLLHAQIEPHFLFNSLASVKRLYETQPVEGRSLIRHVRTYLGQAIPAGRMRETTVTAEIELASALLEIFRVRMDERLRTRVSVQPGAGEALVPPLMLGTLVENAIKHGIGPRATGGQVVIEARRVDEALEVRVADDGVGFRFHSGQGVGLANTRARLRTLYGQAARLELARNDLGGVTATIRLPFKAAKLAEAA